MPMSDVNPISVHPDNAAQKQQIVSQARKQDQSVSEYCLMAIEQRIARETEDERLDELDVDSRLDELKTDITEDIAAAMDVSTHQEDLYEIALWDLLSSDYSEEECREAVANAPDKLDRELEKMAEKTDGEN